MENYSSATHWFFEKYSKEIFKLLIMPFDINCGYSIYQIMHIIIIVRITQSTVGYGGG